MVTRKTWKYREKKTRESVGSFCMWMKTHLTENFTNAGRPTEQNGMLVWLHTLSTKLSRHQTHAICKEHALAPIFFSPSVFPVHTFYCFCEAKTSDQVLD